MELKINKPFTLQVFKKDIKNGKQDNSKSCPLARAFRRCLHTREVCVNEDYLITYNGYNENRYVLIPGWLVKWMRCFDEGSMQLCKPFKRKIKINEDCCLVDVK